jgi:hypothetical protein
MLLRETRADWGGMLLRETRADWGGMLLRETCADWGGRGGQPARLAYSRANVPSGSSSVPLTPTSSGEVT